MGKVIHVLKRGDGRTLYQRGSRLMVRFDSEEDRQRFEAACRLQECVERQDIKAAASIVFDALNGGFIDDEDDLLTYLPEDEAEIIRLELAPMIEAAVSSLAARIDGIWKEEKPEK